MGILAENREYQLIGQLFDLRKKEVLKGLSYEEERKISMLSQEIDEKFSKRQPLNTQESQMECGIMVVSIRRPHFEEQIIKQTLFEKIRKKEQMIRYELAPLDEEDLEYGYYSYAFLLKVRKFMQEIGLEKEWIIMSSPTFDVSGGFEFIFSKEEKEWIEQLPDPAESLQILNQVKDIEDKARIHSAEMLDFIQCVIRYFEEDYFIYIDYTELQFVEIG